MRSAPGIAPPPEIDPVPVLVVTELVLNGSAAATVLGSETTAELTARLPAALIVG